MLEDAATRSRSVAPDSLIDNWFVNTPGLSTFLIQIETLEGPPVAVFRTRAIDGPPDSLALQLPATAVASGPHRIGIPTNFGGVELRALPAEDPGQVSCSVSYTVKWL